MEQVKLICTPLSFYTENDEEAFFSWLEKISCIEKYEGIGNELHLYVTSKNISIMELRDLIGIFDRYDFAGSQLIMFKTDKNKYLFE